MSKEKYGFVYIWHDKKRTMFYIGCHWGTEDDRYICSSNRMRDAYRRRPEDFKRRILARIYTSRKDLLKEEHRWLQLIKDDELGVRYYNHLKHHYGHWSIDKELTEIVRIKIKKNRKSTKGKKMSEEAKRKISHALKGKSKSEEHRLKISAIQKGRPSPNKGKTFNISEENRKRMGHMKGKKTPEHLVRKRAETMRNKKLKWVTNGMIDKKVPIDQLGFLEPEFRLGRSNNNPPQWWRN